MEIAARFNGPPGSGNGGWSAGAFAAAAGARPDGRPYEVTLRVPPPLATELTVAGGRVTAADGTLVAEVTAGGDAGAPVPPVPAAQARELARGYAGLTAHPFPTCYVCGPDRAEGDGLRIFVGRTGDGRTAGPWTVPADVALPTAWAALDCPGGWSVLHEGSVFVLGRITAAVHALPAPGDACTVVGAAEAVRGRKATVGSTLYSPGGAVLAVARAVWIRLDPDRYGDQQPAGGGS